jgi:hypothetical protein
MAISGSNGEIINERKKHRHHAQQHIETSNSAVSRISKQRAENNNA